MICNQVSGGSYSWDLVGSNSSSLLAKLVEALQIIAQLLCCPLSRPLFLGVYILLEGEVISVQEA